MKTPTIVVLFISFVWGFNSFAQSLYVPPYCENNQMDLQVRNLSAQVTNYWLAWMNEQGVSDEVATQVEGLEKNSVNLSEISKSSSFKIYRPLNAALSMQVRCHDSEASLPLTTRNSPIQEFKITAENSQLVVSNLSWNENNIKIEWFSSNEMAFKSKVITLKAKETQKLAMQNPLEAIKIRLTGEFRILSTQSQSLPENFLRKSLPTPPAENGAYFEMGLRQDAQAPKFVVYIDDPQLLAEARRLIQNPQIEKIVFGKIARGHGNYNVDLSNRDQSPWSWHYGQVTGIADIGSTACNGTPEMLEDHLNSWMSNNAYACFWSYRLLREIKAAE